MVRHAQARDTEQLQELWSECFPDDLDFRTFFFKKLYNPEYAMVCTLDDTVCAMLHAFPCVFNTKRGILRAKYIYGVGTGIKSRGIGAASKLLKSVENDCDFLFLIPQNEGLFDFYRKNGYSPEFYIEEKTAEPKGDAAISLATKADIPRLNSIYEKFTAGSLHPVRTESHWAAVLEELSAANGGIALFDKGYFAYYIDGKMPVISEIFPKEPAFASIAAGALKSACTVLYPGSGRPFGAVKFITDAARSAFSENAERYLNLMHN